MIGDSAMMADCLHAMMTGYCAGFVTGLGISMVRVLLRILAMGQKG